MSVKSVYLRVMFGEINLSPLTQSFRYKYTETMDECTIILQDSRENFPDEPYFLERAMLEITWGYLDDKANAKTRVVYVEDVSFQYGQDWVEATITAGPKASNMRHGASKQVHKNTSSFQVAGKIGEQHGVDVKYQPSPNASNNHKESVILRGLNEESSASLKEALEFNKKVDEAVSELNKKGRFKTPRGFKVEEAAYQRFYGTSANSNPIPLKSLNITARANAALNNLKEFEVEIQRERKMANDQMTSTFLKYYNSLPQAGKSNLGFLRELIEQEQGGPYVMEGRDNSLIIRKRNFNQAPKYRFVYGGNERNVKSFSPESKHKSKAALASMAFGGWNKLSKAYIGGSFDAASNPAIVHLNRYMAAANYLNNFIVSGKGGSPLPDLRSFGIKAPNTFRVAQDNINDPTIDNTAVYLRLKAKNFITVKKGLEAINATISAFTSPEVATKYFPGANFDGPGDNFEAASNAQQNAELNRNPGSITVEGIPEAENGIVIEVDGVGQRNGGKYYVTEAEHTMDINTGYELTFTLVRSGTNLPTSPASQPVDSLDKSTNTQQVQRTDPNTKVVTTKN